MMTTAVAATAAAAPSHHQRRPGTSVATRTRTRALAPCVLGLHRPPRQHTACGPDFILRILPQVGHFLTMESDTRIAEEIFKFTQNLAEAKYG